MCDCSLNFGRDGGRAPPDRFEVRSELFFQAVHSSLTTLAHDASSLIILASTASNRFTMSAVSIARE